MTTADYGPGPGTWPERFLDHKAGIDCPMCGNDFTADDIGWGLLLARGEVSNAYLWRSGTPGYCVNIYTGRHVAEPTELNPDEAAAFWRDTLALGRALEHHYQPIKTNYLLLGNAIPHAHFHVIPRFEAGVDAAPGGPVPFAILDHGRQDEQELQQNAAALRHLLRRPDNPTGRTTAP
jgi:diadenosine tetraphosphate (Ap4A) HIT family hydrolase